MSIPQSTTYTVMLKVYLSTDHVTPATGQTVAVVISKGGGAFANPSAGATNATEVANGWYKVTLSTTDTGTIGDLVVRGTASGCDDSERLLSIANAHNGGFDGIPNATAGAASGLWILGTNAAANTTLTGTAASGATPATSGLTVVGGAASTTSGGTSAPAMTWTGGAGAASNNGASQGLVVSAGGTTTVSGADAVTLTATGNANGLTSNGAGLGAGVQGNGGATNGPGIQGTGGSGGGNGIAGRIQAGAFAGIAGVGTAGTGGIGISGAGGLGGPGIRGLGGNAATSTPAGPGILGTGGTASATSGGTAGIGIDGVGGTGAASTNGPGDGSSFTGGTVTSGFGGGNGMTLTHTGSGLDFNATTTPLTLAKTTNITGFNDIAASAIVSSGAISTAGGAVTNVTNLANAPTAGDFTSTMKASLSSALAAGAAGIATAVWQDLTAGSDFTTVGSIGKLIVTTGLNVNVATINGQTASASGTVTFPGTIASPTNITAGTLTTVTNLTNLPSIPANWITAAGIASGALVAAVWDGSISGHTTGGTFGGALNSAASAGDPWQTLLPGSYTTGQAGNIVGNFLTGNAFTRLGAPVGASISNDIAAVKTSVGSPQQVGTKYAVTLAPSDVSGNLAVDLQTIKTQAVTCAVSVTISPFVGNATRAIAVDGSGFVTFNNATAPNGFLTAASIASGAFITAVWDGNISGHTGAGTFGGALNAAGSAGDPWATNLPGGYAPGQAGNIIGNNINATILSRLAAASYVTPPTAATIADTTLRRTMAHVQQSSDGDPVSVNSLYGMIQMGQHSSQAAGVWTVLNPDNSTLGTKALTTDGAAQPITGVN